jgi:thiamine pyrophosphokinase
MNDKKAVILGNAAIRDYGRMKKYAENRFMICCDGGVRYAGAMGLTPDIIIGDFDSADREILSAYQDAGVPFDPYPSQKEETDMALCLQYALDKGMDDVVILGGAGSRLDHTLANIFLLQWGLERNARVRLIDENNEIELIDKAIGLKGAVGGFVSLIPVSEIVTGVTTRGLKYPLRHETLFRASSRGVSNEFDAETAAVAVESGLLLAILARDE